MRCDLFNLPERLYKYYRYDNYLNEKRLTGEVYLASPLDFNDPCDCRRTPVNNAKKMDEKRRSDNPEGGWLELKLQELGYDKREVSKLAVSLKESGDNLDVVYRKQLEKVGVLCITQVPDNPLMWGYYTDNKGFCIEYDKQKIVQRLVIGFINALDYKLTEFLYEDKRYMDDPSERCRNTQSAMESIPHAKKILDNCIDEIKNGYLQEQATPVGMRNFLLNVMLKRFVGKEIEYCDDEKICSYSPTLFFEEENKGSHHKYFEKTKPWAHEREFRVVVSLGGRKSISLGIDIIKAVYLGCNTPKENIVQIAYMLASRDVECKLYIMKRNDRCMLEAVEIDFSSVRQSLKILDTSLNKINNDEM